MGLFLRTDWWLGASTVISQRVYIMDVFLYHNYASDLEQEIYRLSYKLEFNTNLYRLPLLNQENI